MNTRLLNSAQGLTPKAFANFSPGLERSDNPGSTNEQVINPERVNIAQA